MPPCEKKPDKIYPVPVGSDHYRVVDGDDWYSVAKMYKVDVRALILYNCGTLNTDEVNWYLRNRVGCNLPGKWNWKFSSSANPGWVYIPPAFALALQTYTYSIATESWINPSTLLPENDDPPPAELVMREQILGNQGYRFAHFLEATVTIMPTSTGPMPTFVGGGGYTKDSGIYRAPSFGQIPSYAYPIQRFDPATVDGGVEFHQIVGARTVSVERLTQKAVGSIPGMVMQQLVPFPPIWSDLKLTIRYDGTYTGELVGHSLFPSLNYYEMSPMLDLYGHSQAYEQKYDYDGVPNYDRWMPQGKGWGPRQPPQVQLDRMGHRSAPSEGNPWGVTGPDPGVMYGDQDDPNEVARRRKQFGAQ